MLLFFFSFNLKLPKERTRYEQSDVGRGQDSAEWSERDVWVGGKE